jgi:hypothetical protein
VTGQQWHDQLSTPSPAPSRSLARIVLLTPVQGTDVVTFAAIPVCNVMAVRLDGHTSFVSSPVKLWNWNSLKMLSAPLALAARRFLAIREGSTWSRCQLARANPLRKML